MMELQNGVRMIYEMFPNDVTEILEDYETQHLMATVGKNQLIQKYLKEIDESLDKIIKLGFQSD